MYKLNSSVCKLVVVALILLTGQIGYAQRASHAQSDSAVFAQLTADYKKNTGKNNIDKSAGLFFRKASQLKSVSFKGKAAAIISETYFEKHKKSQGENWYARAQAYFKSNNNHLDAGKTNLRIGNLLTYSYDFETGLPYLLKSVDNFNQTKEFNEQAKAHLALSLAYHDFGKYDKGITYAHQALDILERHKDRVNRNLFWYAYNDLGINYDDGKQPKNAINAHLKALPYAANASDSSYSYNNLGNTFKKLGDFTQAEKYFNLTLLTSTDYSDHYHLATLYSNMVDVNRLIKNYAKAHRFIDSTFHYAQLSNSPEKLLDATYYTYQLKKETGNFEEATRYLADHLALKDSFFTAEKNKAVLKYQTQYETERKEKDLAISQLSLAKSNLASKKKDILLLVFAFAMTLVLGALIYLKNKATLKERQLVTDYALLQQKAAVDAQNQRLEIARDLHDSIGAQLTLIGSTTDRLLSNKEYNPATSTKLMKLSHLCESAVVELKNTLWVMNEDVIHLDNLRLKLLNFVNQAAEAKEEITFQFSFEVINNIQISSKMALHIVRLIQELTNNAIKHSGATEVHLGLLQSKYFLLIKFGDNGKGFTIEDGGKESYGLKTIQRRVADVNAKMQVSCSAQGTCYSIEIPL